VRAAAFLCAALLVAGCKPSIQEHFRLAKDAVFEKRPEEALRQYRLALDLIERSGAPEAEVLKARALRGAADVYYLEVRDMRHAVEVYRELIRQCPEAPETLEGRINLAHILRAQYRDLRGAITELTAAIARNPPQSAELSYQVAKLYFELGDYQQCELEAGNLAKRYEASGFVDDALFLRAQALSMMEPRRGEAIKAFGELAERFPESELVPHALYEQGKLRSDAGEVEKAIEIWVKSLERHPDPAVVQGTIARARKRLVNTTPGRIGDRVQAFDRHVAQPAPRPSKAKTSVEAAGGTAEEARSEMTGQAPPRTQPEEL
jgi:tetratricopeptide (TPR) repeat protein